MPDKKYEVKQAKVKEVSLVPAGANGEEFAMFKSYEEEEDESEEEKDMNKTEQNEQGEEDTDESDIEKGGSNEPVEFEEIQEAIEKLDEDEKEELAKELGIEESEVEEAQEDDVEKDLDELPEWAKEEIQKSTERDEKLEELRKERELDELEKSVEEDYSFLPGEARENAEILKSVKDSSEDAFDELVEKLQAVEEQINTSELFKEAGEQDAEPQGDALEKVEKRAEELVEEGEFETMSKAKAHVITEEKPELYDEYREQKKNQ